ncbi:MAG: hypothetical protein AAFP82_18280 [Bacteroidota bacterium]
MAKDKHSNRLDNPNLHHLYFIYDFEEKEIYKFGISDKPVNTNNSSARLEEQIKLYNQVTGSPRFSGKILIKSIQGRRKARIKEDDLILKYEEKHGKRPRGNENHVFLSDKT